jgi:hypothetical protein
VGSSPSDCKIDMLAVIFWISCTAVYMLSPNPPLGR